jgi:3-hydroxy-9,10-secoandrosta-1,3,5(10)-triene-9,17-dione monooxygenase reductase component
VSDPLEPTTDGRPFDAARYRQVLGHFTTGVTVVTSMNDEEPVGLAVGSFSSLSLEPPLVLFCADKNSSSWPKIEAAGVFCVNILSEDQEDLCRAFATRGSDKFGGVGWKKSGLGSPLLDGVLAWADCEISDVSAQGDHFVVIGHVKELNVEHEGGPLLFFRGGYGRFQL